MPPRRRWISTRSGPADRLDHGRRLDRHLDLTGRLQEQATRCRAVRAEGHELLGLVTHIERTPIDVELALQQWFGYFDAMKGAGWDVIEVAPADDCPDVVFVEDPIVVHRGPTGCWWDTGRSSTCPS